MSKYFSKRYENLVPYTPGEQPKEREYIKLNTNESPYPPSPRAIEKMKQKLDTLRLYSDPDCKELREALASKYCVSADMIMVGNGSDDVLNMAFMSFCDDGRYASFADITYGCYETFSEINALPYKKIPVNERLEIVADDYMGATGPVFIANPNAYTGILLSNKDVEKILKANPDNVVVIDEAYGDFSDSSCIPLAIEYENLIVVRTFSKSGSIAGSRLGFAIANAQLIREMNMVRYSINPYNVNTISQAAGIGTLEDDQYIKRNCEIIMDTREKTAKRLREMGFYLTDSKANFLLAKSESIDGFSLYSRLKDRGILVRHNSNEKIKDYIRITIGSPEEMDEFIESIREIIREESKNEKS